MSIDAYWLPKCLAHWNFPYVADTDEQIIIGELSSAPRSGYRGTVFLHTVLVPTGRLDEVLRAPGGIGWKVSAWGPEPVVGEDETYDSAFWVKGPDGNDDKLEPIVVSWERHNKTIMMPDNGLMMCYGLCPRVQTNPDKIIWDDPGRLEYDVIAVKPLSDCRVPTHSGAEVRIARRYLEDFASLKGCAVVAVFYEERHCAPDEDLEAHVDWQSGVTLDLPGRELIITEDIYNKDTPVFCRLWGRKLVLLPSGRPVSEEAKPELEWPGYPGVMTGQRASRMGLFKYVYVSDQVLDQFEGKPEYDTNPEYGSVSHDSWWSFPDCHRIGRDYIAFDILRIHEGCSPSIMKHLHQFAVEKWIVDAQVESLGQDNIGKRASSLIHAFLAVGDELASLGDCLGLAFDGEDIISINREAVRAYALKSANHRS